VLPKHSQVAESNLDPCRDQVYDSMDNFFLSDLLLVVFSKETQDEMELGAWRTARSGDCLPEFSTNLGVHRNPATSNRL
jgi:hypothetical protein